MYIYRKKNRENEWIWVGEKKKKGKCELPSNGYVSFLGLFGYLFESLFSHEPLNDRETFLRNVLLWGPNRMNLHKPRWYSLYIPRLYGIAYCSQYRYLYSMLLDKKTHKIKSRTRENDAIKKHGKHEIDIWGCCQC